MKQEDYDRLKEEYRQEFIRRITKPKPMSNILTFAPRQSSVQPAHGQYVAIWIYEGELFSETYRTSSDGGREMYSSTLDEWVDDTNTFLLPETSVIYYTI